MTTVTANALFGLNNSQQRVAAAAGNIARAGTELGQDVSVDSELVNVEIAKNDFAANATVLKIDKQTKDRLLDILA
jgi:hypothetical protein